MKDRLEPGQITVGTRVVINHLGASKVGAELVIKAALVQKEKNRFTILGPRSRTVRAPSPRWSTSAPPFRCRNS